MLLHCLYVVVFWVVSADLVCASSLHCYGDSHHYPDGGYVAFANSHRIDELGDQDIATLKDYALQGHQGAIQSYLDLKPDQQSFLADFVNQLPKAACESAVRVGLMYLNLQPSCEYLSGRTYERLDGHVADFRGLHILSLLEPRGAYVRGQRAYYALALLWFSQPAQDVLAIEKPEYEAVNQFSQWHGDTCIDSTEDENIRKQFIQLLSLRAARCGEDMEKLHFYIHAMQLFTAPEEEVKPAEPSGSMKGYLVAAIALPLIWVGHSVFQSFHDQ